MRPLRPLVVGLALAMATAIPCHTLAPRVSAADAPASLPVLPATIPDVAVLRVVDGDTLDVQLPGAGQERVRLIGMDTPETVDPRQPVQCFGQEASGQARALLDGQTVTLALDPAQDQRDRYGRLLAYAFLPDGRNVAQAMIGAGYAHEYTYGRPYAYQADFKAAQEQARAGNLGLWAPETCAGQAYPSDLDGLADGPVPVSSVPAASTPAAPPPAPAAGSPLAPGFDPARYIGQGDAFNCPDFGSQAEAQAVLRAPRPIPIAWTPTGTASPARATASRTPRRPSTAEPVGAGTRPGGHLRPAGGGRRRVPAALPAGGLRPRRRGRGAAPRAAPGAAAGGVTARGRP